MALWGAMGQLWGRNVRQWEWMEDEWGLWGAMGRYRVTIGHLWGRAMGLYGAEMEGNGNGWRMNGGYGLMGRYGAL